MRLFLLILCLLASQIVFAMEAPRAVEGIVDLRAWDIESQGPVNLSGEYEFYWQQHLDPTVLPFQADLEPDFIEVPGNWNNEVAGGVVTEAHGYATYRLNVLVNRVQPYSLKLPDVGTSYRLMVDGKQLIEIGNAGRSATTSTAKYYPTSVTFTPRSTRIEILFHVSNFEYRMGGVWLPIKLGTPDQIEKATESQRSLDLLLFGAIVMIGLYNLALFALRHEDPSSLYLGLFCLLLATRLLAVGERYLTRIFDLPFDWYVRVEYLSWILAVSAFAAFVGSVLPNQFSRLSTMTAHVLVAIASVFILVTPVQVFSFVVPPFQLITIVYLIIGSVAFGLAIRDKIDGALILTLAYAVLFYAVVNDILVNTGIIDSVLLLDIGLLVFTFFQSLLISYRFTRSFKMIESQRISLQATNLRLQTQEKLRKQAEIESEHLQGRIAPSQKMSTVETLVAGISDDLNAMLEKTTTSEENRIAANLVQELLIMTEANDSNLGQLPLNNLVKKYLKHDRHQQLRKRFTKLTTRLELDSSSLLVFCNETHLIAMMDKLLEFYLVKPNSTGEITITTYDVSATDETLFFGDLPDGDYAVLGVGEASGELAVPGDLEAMFDAEQALESFKKMNTGLGLALVKNIVLEHSGAIDVILQEDGGTRIEVYLPANPI